jgi:hypothetical protein
MQRDLDKVREILLYIEANQVPLQPLSVAHSLLGLEQKTDLMFYESLLRDAGYLKDGYQTFGLDEPVSFGQITHLGHEYIAKVRDPEVWRKTKEIAAKAGGGGIEIVSQIASSVISTAIATALKIQGN